MKGPKFTPTVIEIDNPEELILFRKVIVPASMGDDTEVVPAVGKYKNVLLHYDANDANYLYSSDGIPTKITSAVPQEVLDRLDALEEGAEAEAEARERADAALSARIELEEENRARADASLENDIISESASRQAADTRLETAISGLTDALATETTARTTADTTLQNNIDEVAGNLSAEISAREGSEEHLHDLIDAVSEDLSDEEEARVAADAGLNERISDEAEARAEADAALNNAVTTEASMRQTADEGLQSQIDAITASSDVKDIVGTYAELQRYDTSTLGDRDIIKVLQDEEHDDETTYYRYDTTTQQFALIGEEGPYYTKSQTDGLLNAKQNVLTQGNNIQIVGDTISATDTTYTNGAGLNLVGTQFSVDTSTIATKESVDALDVRMDAADASIEALEEGKQGTLTAGEAINITENVISATNTGMPKVLTDADNNYPVDNPSSVALWLLPPGFYTVEKTITVYETTSVRIPLYAGAQLVVGADAYGNRVYCYWTANDNSGRMQFVKVSSGGSSYIASGTILDSGTVVDNLSSSASNAPLSARQGKALNDKIGGDLDKLETADKTSLINAINELAEQGGSGVTTLTSADYNWPVSAPTGIAQWLLEDGTYQVGEDNLAIYPDVDSSALTGVLGFTKITYADGSAGGSLMVYATTEVPSTVGGGSSTLRFWIANPQTGGRRSYGRLSFPMLNSAGDNTASAITQDAATNLVYADPATRQKVRIGTGAIVTATAPNGISIGLGAESGSWGSIAIGPHTQAYSYSGLAIGINAAASGYDGSMAIGAFSGGNAITAAGMMHIGTSNAFYGYNNSNYRLLSGLYDGQGDHDAVTVGQMNAAIAEAGGADELEASDWEKLWQ